MTAQTKGVDVLADPIASVRVALDLLFRELTSLLPEDDRNFGPSLHGRVLRAMAGDSPEALDAVERYLILRDGGHVPELKALRADVLSAALSRATGGAE